MPVGERLPHHGERVGGVAAPRVGLTFLLGQGRPHVRTPSLTLLEQLNERLQAAARG